MVFRAEGGVLLSQWTLKSIVKASDSLLPSGCMRAGKCLSPEGSGGIRNTCIHTASIPKRRKRWTSSQYFLSLCAFDQKGFTMNGTHAHVLSYVQLFATPWTIACQAPLSMGFPKQEYWSGSPLSASGNLPNPGTEPMSPALADGPFTTEPLGKSMNGIVWPKLQR